MTISGMTGNTRQRGFTVWLTGLSGAGKSSVAFALEAQLLAAGHNVYVLDGDVLRSRLNRDLGFSPADRQENIRRAAEVAHLMNDAGLIVIGAFISPQQADRDLARDSIGAGQFVETYISTPIAVCEARDPKGLYRKARAGLIAEFTGVSAPYEAPQQPALALDTATLSLDQACQRLLEHLAPRLTAAKT
jgi:adenylylsulfate kinase